MRRTKMFPLMMFPAIPNICKLSISHDYPPTVYALLNSYVNYNKPENEHVKIKDLARTGRNLFFDFDYPLSSHVTKADFETLILNHFLMRRIGYETVTAFNIALSVKINEIMPYYNKLLDALSGWDILNDGYSLIRETRNNNSTETSSTGTNTSSDNNTTSDSNSSTSDLRFSDTPQNQIQDVRDGKYITSYNYNQNAGSGSTSSTSSSTSSSSTSSDGESTSTGYESTTKTAENKIGIYTEFLQNREKIYTMIFKELDSLFYQLTSF